MTVREVAEVLGVSKKTVINIVNKLYPDLMQHGKMTRLNLVQVTEVKQETLQNRHLVNCASADTVETELDEVRNVVKAMTYLQRRGDKLQAENGELKKKIEIMKPKEIVYDKVMSGENTHSQGAFAKMVGMGRNESMRLQREYGILMDDNVPYQQYMKYFDVIDVPVDMGHQIVNVPTSRVRASGVDFLTKLFKC